MAPENSGGNRGQTLTGLSLFSQVQYLIILSEGLTKDEATKLTRILNENGAVQHYPPSKTGQVPLKGLTHIISATIDFEEFKAASDALIPVIKSEWITSSLDKKKLANTRVYSPDPRLIFSGLVVCCADLPEGDKDAIIGGVLAMGGLYSPSITKLVTHLVALNVEPQKCQTAIANKLTCKIILPHWFDDCLRLGKRIDEAPYILPDPEIHRLRFGEKIPDASRPDLQGATSAHPARLPNSRSSPSRDRQRLSIFESKHIMLSSDLEIANHLRETIEGLIRSGGGKVVTNIDEADILICQYRESKIFKLAWQASKTIGNLSWLYFLITHNRWTSPLKRLLHYPIARKGLPKCKDLRISLSNYNGEARTYLENLARAAGCEFTKTMKMDNTHLIAAHIFSEKCEAAKEWNINIVNHLWLEDSYAKWEIQSLSNPKYTHFPPRTNLSEVVGQTTIDLNAIARHFLPEPTVTSSELQRSAVSSVMNGGRTEKCQTINKILESSAVQPSSSIVDGLGQHPKWIDAVTMTPRASKQIGGQISEIISKTPAGSSSREKGKENETPSTSSSRGAKDRAVVKLHNLAPDIALYEKEKKRIGGVIFGGRRTSEEKSLELRHKRSMSKDDDSMVDGRDATRVTKRARKGKSPPKMRLLITGYNNWVGDLKKENEGRLQLRELGILITPDPTHCTHLAAPRILRTPNFLCAMANAPILLSTRFVDECLAQNSLLRPEDYKLKDPEGEKRHEVRLIDVAERAKANKGRLLRNCYIYCTENVHGGFEAYKSIVDVNGGSCLLYRARGGSLTISKFADNDGSAEGSESGQFDYVYLITATTHVDAKLWPKFRLMAKKAGKTPRIVRNDWLLDLALTQQIRWLDKYEVTEDSVVQES